MKRIILSVLLCLSVVLSAVGTAAAEPAVQESDDPNLIDAASIFMSLLSAGAEAAVQQIENGGGLPEMNEPTAVPEIPTAAPIVIPTAIPTAVPTVYIPPVPTEEPVQNNSAPDDPESVSVSTGITISEFYDSFKTNVKEGGRHSVAFAEKGGKNASKVTIDDMTEVFLCYNKDRGRDLVDHLTFKANYSGDDEKYMAQTFLWNMFETLGDFLNIDLDESMAEDVFEMAYRNGSAVYSDLLVYGSAAGGGTAAVVTVNVYYTGGGYVAPVTTTYSLSAEESFRDMIAGFKDEGLIPDYDGSFNFHEDYENEWAQINWYQWESFDYTRNFVISADITWKSASSTPNYDKSGCGFVFRSQDTSNNLYAAVNMDGNAHFGGIRNGSWLNYGSYRYGSFSTKGSAQMVLVVNEDRATVFVDGARLGQQWNLALDEAGSLAFSVWSGTNKDFGTRCTFQNVYYYTW